jgi:cathepsin B
MLFLLALCVVLSTARYEEEIAKIASVPGLTWVPGHNSFFDDLSMEEVRSLMGYRPSQLATKSNIPKGRYSGVSLPASFDGRTKWTSCSGLFNPLNQGQCGSCWAFGATKSFGDRLCIATNATTNVELSEQVMVSCNLDGEEGCTGGDPVTALRYIAEYGLPSSQCVPYVSGKDGKVPNCPSKCVNGSPMQVYYASLLSLRWHLTLEGIMESIYNEGPVEACFTVYSDFMHYQSGVYSHVTGSELGGHCIVLLGWGTTSAGVDYWIAQNSWGNSWGLNGYFWIKRGADECGIEHEVFSIMPKL